MCKIVTNTDATILNW